MSSQAFNTAKRAMGLSKTYLAIAIFVSILALSVWNYPIYAGNGSSNNTIASDSSHSGIGAAIGTNIGSSLPLFSVPFYIFPMLMLVTPIVVLFVYDKNTGVLEYLLSVGLSVRDIYMRYLKAAVLLSAILMAVFAIADEILFYLVHGVAGAMMITPTLALAAALGFSAVALTIMLMMAFSSLQKTRVGSNQPLAIIVGVACTVPGFFIPFAFTYKTALIIEMIEAVLLGLFAVFILFSSEKLIKREKFLP